MHFEPSAFSHNINGYQNENLKRHSKPITLQKYHQGPIGEFGQGSRQGKKVVFLDKSMYKDMALPTHIEMCHLILQRCLRGCLKRSLWGYKLGHSLWKCDTYLCLDYPLTPIFHGLPKVHKNVSPPPLHHIISGTGSLNERLYQLLDDCLQTLDTSTLSMLRTAKKS